MANSKRVKFTAGDEEAGMRVDRATLFHVADVSRARVQQLIEDGSLQVNGLRVKQGSALRKGDKVTLDLAPREAPPFEAQDIPLKIVYEDPYIAVVDKPAGLVVHPGAGVADGTLANAILHHFGRLPGAEQLRPGIVHRLDKETSGLIIVTKTEESQDRFSRMFQDRKIYKEYVALVHGGMNGRSGRIDKPVGRHPVHRTKMTTHAPRSRPCLTEWAVEREIPGFTLLKVTIHTGRTHQIRVHLASMGRPVVGDAVYGGGNQGFVRDGRVRHALADLGRFFLHARKLRFRHPFTGAETELESPLPEELRRFLSIVSGDPMGVSAIEERGDRP